jgi:hypothetical protein
MSVPSSYNPLSNSVYGQLSASRAPNPVKEESPAHTAKAETQLSLTGSPIRYKSNPEPRLILLSSSHVVCTFACLGRLPRYLFCLAEILQTSWCMAQTTRLAGKAEEVHVPRHGHRLRRKVCRVISLYTFSYDALQSISGIVAARICGDHFERVIIVDPEIEDSEKPKTRILQYNAGHGE